MRRIPLTLSLLILICSIAVVIPLPVGATLVDYTFSVTATGGPLNGTTETGTFSYDTSSITPGATNNNAGLLIDLNFSWNGIPYDETTANTGNLIFDSAGELLSAVFGNNCVAGSCVVTNGYFSGTDEWFVAPDINGIPRFVYGMSGENGIWYGTVTFASASVPEPSTILLLGSGLVGLIGYGRRRLKK